MVQNHHFWIYVLNIYGMLQGINMIFGSDLIDIGFKPLTDRDEPSLSFSYKPSTFSIF